VALLVAFALTVYINGAVWDYWGSMGFSNRRFTEMSAPLGLGMALVLASVFRYAEREPRRLAGAMLGLVVGAFSVWNLAAMTGVGSGRIANWREARSDLIWEQIFHELAHGTYEAVGNPAAWPASLPFALRFGTHPMRYDAMRGMSLYYAEYETGQPRPGETTAIFAGAPLHALYATDGFSAEPETLAGRRGLRVSGEHARLLLPLFLGEVGAVSLRLRMVGAWPWGRARPLERHGPRRAVRLGEPLAAGHVPHPARRGAHRRQRGGAGGERRAAGAGLARADAAPRRGLPSRGTRSRS
jgi:hypothetical protein